LIKDIVVNLSVREGGTPTADYAVSVASTHEAHIAGIAASTADVGDQFSCIARRFDLAIIGQSGPEGSAVEAVISESTLFDSGRPMIIVPYIHKAPFKLEPRHGLLGWQPAGRASDGRRYAAP
jgi:hypothetical protein